MPASEGDFSRVNTHIDIVGEWLEGDGSLRRGVAWATREGNTIGRRMIHEEITVALVDYSCIPELTVKPIFTDDVRELREDYLRYAAGVEFNDKNLGPLAGRMPVVLIHGLQLDNMEDEPFDLNDQSAEHGESGWISFLNAINNYQGIFDDFKFFWYCYPTGVPIYGSDGSGAQLREKLDKWLLHNSDHGLVFRPMIIISHSMGGLVAREFTQFHAKGLSIPRIISIASPHYGSPIVNVGKDLVGIPFFGWLDMFLTEGVYDLACDETIKYKWLGFTFTADLDENLGLRALNQAFPEGDERLICYGATSTSTPNPSISDDHYLPLLILDMVQSPSWLCESYGGFHSDCVVNWPSQYYTKSGGPDLTRNSTRYHMEIMSDPLIHSKLFAELYEILEDY
jgi:pimeloyl-ACP methyl ester carboxylesterase